MCFSLHPLPPVLSLGTTQKTLAPYSLFPPHQVFDKIPPNLLVSSPSSLSLSSHKRCFRHFFIFVALHWTQSNMSMSFSCWEAPEAHQDTQVLLCRTSFQPLHTQPVLVPGVSPLQGQDFPLPMIELHEVPPYPLLQFGQVPLDIHQVYQPLFPVLYHFCLCQNFLKDREQRGTPELAVQGSFQPGPIPPSPREVSWADLERGQPGEAPSIRQVRGEAGLGPSQSINPWPGRAGPWWGWRHLQHRWGRD